ncbi:TusA-like sulfurtransferase [Desulfuromonas soudanensis]|uniref:TusA-like sulfurtransferase n=1 Tax=Desulfuromonas soudanensis TaxID=1603606 RepID=A0A0M4D026_9BACT|nr:sulfurtransferase TusA family protein [Desulfuromonas soudanensis]ALC15126.1 TusA-like sulfurtransferase [Desulfuromonas soudanensis]
MIPPFEESILDIRGQVCPSSLLTTLRALNQNAAPLRRGSLRLRILTDSRDAVSTIPAAAENMGFLVRVEKLPAGHYEVVISHAAD